TRLSPEELNAVHDTTGLLTSPADVVPMGLAYQGCGQIEDAAEEGPGLEGMLRKVTKAIRGPDAS
ncbi:MAG: hypothetical protein WB801_01045, partial [Candidatus Dormiibacterota bacterium]